LLQAFIYIYFFWFFSEFCKLDMVHHFMMQLYLKICGQLNKMTRSYEVFCKEAREGLTMFAQFESLYFKGALLFCFDLFLSFVNWIWCISWCNSIWRFEVNQINWQEVMKLFAKKPKRWTHCFILNPSISILMQSCFPFQ
jgi:hypothetical protein